MQVYCDNFFSSSDNSILGQNRALIFQSPIVKTRNCGQKISFDSISLHDAVVIDLSFVPYS